MSRAFKAIRAIDYTVVFVRDMAAMRRFYEDVLGFALLRERSLDWIEYQIGANTLALATPKCGYVGAHRGVGRSFRQVLEDLERGVSPRHTGGTSAGIGAAMRIAPAAGYFADDPEALFDAVMAASLMTHRDIRSLVGAVAVASAVRRLMAGEKREPSFLFGTSTLNVKIRDMPVRDQFP